jgi:hypothetical protein
MLLNAFGAVGTDVPCFQRARLAFLTRGNTAKHPRGVL